MKKITLILLTLVMAVLFAVPAFAAQTATVTITPSASTAYAGNSVTFIVKVTGCSAAKSIGIIPTYDSSVFELVSGEWLVTGAAMSDFSGGTASIAYASARGFNENVFKFTMKVKSGAKLEASAVSATVSIKNGNETVNCNVTGGKVTVACKHSYSGYTSLNDTQHQRVCSKCKAVDKKNHTFSNACDTSCNDCGYTRSTTHNYKTSWSSNGSQHWHECSVCGDKKDVAAHTPGPAATESSAQKCTVCQRVLQNVLEHVHVYEQKWEKDENSHWQICTSCQQDSAHESHVYDSGCDADCNTCGYERTVTHSYGTKFESDETGHWHICTGCQTASAKEDHTYDGDCDTDCNDCGYVRTVTHTYDTGKVTAEPSVNKPGEKVYTCTNCGHKKTVELEHVTGQAGTPGPAPTEPAVSGGIAWWWLLIVGLVGLLGGYALSYLVKIDFS